MNTDIILKVIDTLFQFILVIFAGLALFSWKKETRGRERYNFARDLLKYIQELVFFVHTKNKSWHQIYINDIITDRENFFKDQLFKIGNEKVVFDESVWGLFKHVNMRSDIFLPKSIRLLLKDLCPRSGEVVGSKNQFTYMELGGGIEMSDSEMVNYDDEKVREDSVYQINGEDTMTIEEYFQKWEKLILELRKFL